MTKITISPLVTLRPLVVKKSIAPFHPLVLYTILLFLLPIIAKAQTLTFKNENLQKNARNVLTHVLLLTLVSLRRSPHVPRIRATDERDYSTPCTLPTCTVVGSPDSARAQV